VKSNGLVIANADDPKILKIAKPILKKLSIVWCSIKKPTMYHAANIKLNSWNSEFTFNEPDNSFNINLGIPGIHNISNAVHAITAARIAGIKIEIIQDVCKKFHGVNRRFQVIGKYKKAIVIDDYAHHPNEIQATMQAAYNLNFKVYTIFQPHRFSRTEKLMPEFVEMLSKIDNLILTNIYKASESGTDKIIKDLYQKISEINKSCKYVDDINHIENTLKKLPLTDKCCLLVLGAGNISQVIKDIISKKNGSKI